MNESTARLGLPLIQPGQAQKELFHNEALALLDLCVQPAVVASGLDSPPGDPGPGQCWLVGPAPTGAWSGQAHALAGWTGGGWRFVAPVPGMTVRLDSAAGFARWDGAGWRAGTLVGTSLALAGQQVVGARRPAIADPAGGATTDTEARAAVVAILGALRDHGLIAR